MAEQTGWQRLAKRIRIPMGFVTAAVFLWLARPTWTTLLSSLALTLPGLWLRAYAAGYVRKNKELTTRGPYGHTRNPLYLGSMAIAFGFGVAAGSVWLVALLALLFAVIYIPTIQGEEAYLRAHFAGFDAYCKQVPRLLPSLRRATAMGEAGAFSKALYLHHREYNAAMGAGGIYLALVLRLLWPLLRLKIPR